MKKLVLLFTVLLVLTSCDDGDVIVTEIDFDDVTLQVCSSFEFEYVFYKIKDDPNETLALEFTTTIPIFESSNLQDTIALNGQYSYRIYDDIIPSDYFCSAIPPATPAVTDEFVSTDGNIIIRTEGIETDTDGIPSSIEDLMGDSDQDGYPDSKDDDDDGDNVPTLLELGPDFIIEGNTILMAQDTDGDGTPDYLDEDDDGDGILTRNEDANMDLNPANDNSDPNEPTEDDYLNDQIAVETIVNAYREHTYIITGFKVAITLNNTILVNPENGDEIRNQRFLSLGELDPSDLTITKTPDFN